MSASLVPEPDRNVAYNRLLARERARGMLIRRLGVAVGDRVLVLCSGAGHDAVDVARIVGSGGEVVAVDHDAQRVNRIATAVQREGLPAVRAVQADVRRLGFPRGSYDHVICAFGLQFLVRPLDLLPYWADLLRPGGGLGLLVWAVSGPDSVFRNIGRHLDTEIAALAAHPADSDLGDAGVIAAAAARHGLTVIAEDLSEHDVRYTDVAHFTDLFMRGPELAPVLAELGAGTVARLRRAVESTAAAYWDGIPVVEVLRARLIVLRASADREPATEPGGSRP